MSYDKFYKARTTPELVKIPAIGFIAVDGAGDPNSSERFQDAVEALYGVAFGIKMSPKKDDAPPGYEPYKVGALEGLWWIRGRKEPIDLASEEAMGKSKDEWSWTLLIPQPDFVKATVVARFRNQLREKKPDNPVVADVRFEKFAEGMCVQCLHVGPYATEPETMAKMKTFAEEQGKRLTGKHHEIYLGDPRRAKPEKLRTILRHPVS
ncbi:MAG: GyrI-like domain-containing protein [Thermoleophilaceae bacterium]